MEQSLETSLGLLDTDYVDLWQIHNVDKALLAQIDVVAEVFAAARRAGKVRAVGGSTYAAELPLLALETDVFDMLQVTYSVLDQRLADEVLPAAAARNVGIVVRSILLKGALTSRGDHLPEHLAELRERSRQFRKLVTEAPAGRQRRAGGDRLWPGAAADRLGAGGPAQRRGAARGAWRDQPPPARRAARSAARAATGRPRPAQPVDVGDSVTR